VPPMRLPAFALALLLPPLTTAAEPVDFAKQVRPLFEQHCTSCHGAAKQKGGLRLNTGQAVLKGGLSGPVVVPKKSADSRLMHALHGKGDLDQMPPKGKLPDADLALIARWIDEGATVPAEAEPVHWSFAPPKQAAAPDGVHPVDHFLKAEWDRKHLTPAGEADRVTLVRRLYLDLTGLPPTAAEAEAFINSTSPDSYEKLIDTLLASPRYGERWGRHLLDVWRYSDWYGYGGELRNSQKHIWRWRDWVVENLNANTKYDRLVTQMLAADETGGDVRATGYLARSYYKFNRNVWLDDVVEHTGKAFLGVTFNCAKCHDHMYDPIAQEEYYRLRAVFEPHQLRIDPVAGQPDVEKDGVPRVYDANPKATTYLFERGNEKTPRSDKPLSPGVPAAFGPKGFAPKEIALPPEAAHPTLREEVRKTLIDAAAVQVKQFKAEPRNKVAVVQLQAVKAKLAADAARYAKPANPKAAELIRHAVALHLETLALAAEADLAEAEEALAALKDAKQIEAQKKKVADLKPKVDSTRKACETPPADYPPLLPNYPETSTGRRAALAAWVTSKDNPLPARVFVNHVWMRHFGQPLVPTVFEFGKNGRPPTHPALLDWLAVEFMKSDWDVKKLHKLMLTSKAYRMASSFTGPPADANRNTDPDNLLVWRMTPRPLEAEAVRDSLLSVSGLLDVTAGGPELDHNDDAPKLRRSLYYRHAPEKQMPFLTTFDGASPTECYRRSNTVVPQQAMALVNSKVSARAAEAVAKEITTKEPSTVVNEAFRRVLLRPPTEQEAKLCADFLAKNPPAALVQVLFNHADFTTIR
jgi:mono/diheme cytochrome c family protein